MQTLATVTLSVQLVHSSKTQSPRSLDSTRPSCQHQLRPRHTPAMQHSVHVRLAVRASNHIDTPVNPTHCQKLGHQSTNSTNISYPHRTSSCTSTTQPTSATRIKCPAASLSLNQHQLSTSNVSQHFYDSTNISNPHRTSSCTSMTRPISATRIERLAAPSLQLQPYQLPTSPI